MGGQLCLELTFIVKAVRECISNTTDENFADKELQKVFNDSKLSNGEILKNHLAEQAETANILTDLLKDIFR